MDGFYSLHCNERASSFGAIVCRLVSTGLWLIPAWCVQQCVLVALLRVDTSHEPARVTPERLQNAARVGRPSCTPFRRQWPGEGWDRFPLDYVSVHKIMNGASRGMARGRIGSDPSKSASTRSLHGGAKTLPPSHRRRNKKWLYKAGLINAGATPAEGNRRWLSIEVKNPDKEWSPAGSMCSLLPVASCQRQFGAYSGGANRVDTSLVTTSWLPDWLTP